MPREESSGKQTFVEARRDPPTRRFVKGRARTVLAKRNVARFLLQ